MVSPNCFFFHPSFASTSNQKRSLELSRILLKRSFLSIYTGKEKRLVNFFTITAIYLSRLQKAVYITNVSKQLACKNTAILLYPALFWWMDIHCTYPKSSQLQMPPHLPGDDRMHITANPITYSHRYRVSKMLTGGRTKQIKYFV